MRGNGGVEDVGLDFRFARQYNTRLFLERQMARPIIDEDCCKGCGRCVAACMKKCLKLSTDRLNAAGLKPVLYVGEGCVGCGMCFYNCPEPYAIRVERG